MTTGVKGTPFPAASVGGFYKTFSGANGKFETVNNKVRVKFNPYTCYIESQTASISTLGYWINVTGVPDQKDVWSPADEVELQARLVEKVRGHSFNLAVDAAQGSQTVNMVVDALRSLRKASRAIRRGNLNAACKALSVQPKSPTFKSKELSGRWLEVQYGWLPLLSSVHESVDAYAAICEDRKNTVTASLHRKRSFDGAASPFYKAPGIYHYRKKIIFEASEVVSPYRSLGLFDPLTVAWELIPYSFVVDWFIPIGTFLDNLSVIPFLNGRFVTTVYRYSTAKCEKAVGPANFPYYDNASARYSRTEVIRTVSTGLPVAKPSFISLPDAMSPRRVWNAIALTAQRL